ncbi:MAG: ComF family protein [Candidatus Levybacteria bacterium]|nr:ComF family protein [Candidatus Levybacteria bacterium]
MELLDLIFPKRCASCKAFGSYLCPDCFAKLSFTANDVCLVCNRLTIDSLTHPGCRTRYSIDGAFASLVYTGVMKRLVYAFKYKPYLTDLREALTDLFYEGLIQKERFHSLLDANPMLIPIPLHASKLRSRGYNQAEVLSIGLNKKFGIPTRNLLQRTKDTPSQFKLSRVDRISNVKGAFFLTEDTQREIAKKTIFLVDDVLTSGATLAEAARALKRGGAEAVYGLALAHGK